MPFGKYGAKSVQMMNGLFNTGMANRAAFRVGSIGRNGMAGLNDLEGIIGTGRKRIGVGALGGGIVASQRSSGSRGLQTRSSAPQPGMPPFPR